jgi:hypothetical protein
MEMVAVQPQQELTFKDVWAMFQETDKMFQASKTEHDRMIAETKEEMKASKAEHDRMIAETNKKFQETDKKFQETDKLQKANAKQIKALNDQMGGLHNSFGELAEHLVAPSIAEKFNALGYHFDSIAPGGKKILDDQGKELAQIDLLLENGEYSVAVEVKSRPKEKDIEHHVVRLQILRQYMNKHHDTRVIRGALAGAIFPEIVKEAAIEAGLHVIVQTGDTMQIETPAGFTPHEW